MTKLAFILGSMLGASVLVAACASTGINEGAVPGGGGVGDGGAGEGGAAGGGAGKPNAGTGATDPGRCAQHPDCKSFGDCDTLDDLEEAVCRQYGGDDFVRYASQCGGTYVEQTGGVTAASWAFDASGNQIGAFEESESSCSEWGSQCGPSGPGKPLCGIGGEGGIGGQGNGGAGVGGAGGAGGGAGGAAGAGGSD